MSSERVDLLDAAAEVFYRRLMSKVDDHGLYDARPSILRSSLYPLRVDRVREADITRWIAACEKAGVIALYAHEGKPYLQMLDTRWIARSQPRFPIPPENTCKQPQTVVPVFGVGVGVGVVVEDVVIPADAAKPSRKKSKTSLPADFAPNETGRKLCAEAGFTVTEEALKFINHHTAQGSVMADWQAGFRTWIDKAKTFRKGPAPTRHTDTAEATVRLLDERNRNAAPMPAAVRELANKLTGRKAA